MGRVCLKFKAPSAFWVSWPEFCIDALRVGISTRSACAAGRIARAHTHPPRVGISTHTSSRCRRGAGMPDCSLPNSTTAAWGNA
eukprot:1156557-Pelagomonas_calceolata.AAC.3